MPFLGVYDNVLVQALIVPLHNLHWGWGFVSEHFVPQVFSRLPKSEGWQIRTPSPFLYLYTNRREFVELYRQKKTLCRYEKIFIHRPNYWIILFLCL